MKRKNAEWVISYSSNFSVPLTFIFFSFTYMSLITQAKFRNTKLFLNTKQTSYLTVPPHISFGLAKQTSSDKAKSAFGSKTAISLSYHQ